jgi:cell division protein FtsI (penicillin-binding protein 3)
MTYADPDAFESGPRPIQLSGWGSWWLERVWALEHAFERSKAAGRPVDDTQLRIFMLLGLFALVFSGLAMGATYAAVFSEAARASHGGAFVHPARADLVDRNGRLLAMDLTHYGVYLDPAEVWDKEETRRVLRRALPKLSAARLERALGGERRTLLIGGLTPQDKAKVRDLGLPGISFEPEQRRVYPLGAQAAHLIGFTDFGGQGIAGAERALNDDLIKAGSGATVPLSIDLRVQAALEEELQAAAIDQRVKGAVGIVTDVRTGEVLGMASWPDFHPGEPGAATPEQRLNRAAQSVYEMGSTFKGLTLAAGLESGSATRTSTYDATQPFRIGSRTVRDFHATHRVLTLDEVFIKSSNIGTSRIALAVGPDAFSGYLRDWGLFKRAPIELAESARPILPREWNENTLASASFGHAISVTPLQLAAAMQVMVNGGQYVPLTIRKREGAPPVGRRVLSETTSRHMLDLMRLNVTNGSGRRADAPGLRVGGKTGTGEKVVNGRYDNFFNVSSFAAVFPTDGPIDAQRYFVLILMDEPKGSEATLGQRTGGFAAAPAAGRVIDRIAPFLGVARVFPPPEADLKLAAAGTASPTVQR